MLFIYCIGDNNVAHIDLSTSSLVLTTVMQFLYGE